MKMLVGLLVLGVAIGTGTSANAKGCIKGALVGGVAGHMAGHGAVGAAAGCVIGHHEANKRQNANSEPLTAALAPLFAFQSHEQLLREAAEH